MRAYKPVVTGLEDRPRSPHATVAARPRSPRRRRGHDPEEVAPLRYGPAVSPHLAAGSRGSASTPRSFSPVRASQAGAGTGTLIVEGVGGLLTPLAEDYTVCDLAVELGCPC